MPVAQPGAPKCPPFASLCECNKNHYYYIIPILVSRYLFEDKVGFRLDVSQCNLCLLFHECIQPLFMGYTRSTQRHGVIITRRA